MAIKFESKKEGTNASAEKAAKAKAPVEANFEHEAEAANAPEMPFAKPAPRQKKGPRR